MSLAQSIAPHLPFLRRFARALSGSQDSGDAYVTTLLEAIVAAPESFPTTGDPRVDLYRAFLKIWGSIDINTADFSGGDPDQMHAAEKRLEVLMPLPRQAFLLAAVEAFNTAQVATIMDIEPIQVTALLDDASTDIANQMATNVLIIEDEPLIAMDLEDLVTSLGHRVARVTRTHKEAVAAAREESPGLVLADIQLADGSSGVEAVNEILTSYTVPVIFITAYPQRLLTGERPEPAFLITKPFEANTVKAIISQALFFQPQAAAITPPPAAATA